MDWKDSVAGGVGGSLSVLCAHPFDTVKVRLQTTNKYRGMRDCFRTMIRQEGGRALFKGMSFPLVSVTLVNVIAFSSYTTTVRLISATPERPKWHELAIGGAAAGVAVCVLSPIELIKIRLQGVEGKMASPVAMTADTVKRGGVFSNKGLYRGLGTQLARDPFGYSVYYLPYVFASKFLEEHGVKEPYSIVVGGAIAGVLSWMVTNPFDVVKTRYQSDMAERSGRSVCRELNRREGVGGFTRGLFANSFRGIPQSASLFLGYEMTLKFLKNLES